MRKLLYILLVSVVLSFAAAAQTNIRANNGTFTGTVTATGIKNTGNEIIGGGSPWYDVTSATFGAKCDGVTDDSSAFNAAIAAAQAAGGGTVFVPPAVCVISTFLNGDNTVNVAIIGMSGTQYPQPSFELQRPRLKFTGNPSTPADLIRFRSALGCRIEGLEIESTNAAFAGNIIDLSHNGGDSQGCRFVNDLITGSTTAAAATCEINALDADNIKVDGVSFMWAVNGVCISFTNGITISNSNFSNSIGTISGAFIKGNGAGGAAATIGPGNDFEMGTGAGTPNIIDCTSGCATMLIVGNAIQDIPAGYNGIAFKNMPIGVAFVGNQQFFGGTGKAGTLFSTSGASRGLTFTGNSVASWATVFSFGGNMDSTSITGNDWSSGGTLSSALFSANPTSGIVTDQNNKTTIYGSAALSTLLANYNGIATVSNGVATEYAIADLTAQTANVANNTIYAVPASGAGQYRVSVSIIVTSVGTTSTMPAVQVTWTDKDSSVVITRSVTATDSTNTTATLSSAVFVLDAKASTNIQWDTSGYASTGSAMQYSVHVKVEAL